MTLSQVMMWTEIRAMARDGAMVELSLKKEAGENTEQDEVIHGRLEFVPPDVTAKDAKLVICTKDYSGGVEHSCTIPCARVQRAVRQSPQANRS